MSSFWVLLLYNLLLPVVLVVGFPKFLIKGIRRGGLARNFRQRLGLYTAAQKERFKAGPNLWIHAVSVGEVRVALKVARELRRLSPRHTVVISTTTPTGYRLAEKEAPDGAVAIYNPVDLPWVVGRAMRQLRPDCLVLVEAEVWPNLVTRASRDGVPVVLINARLSERSERRFRRFAALTAPIFGLLDRVAVQFEVDAPRMASLGIGAERITVTGSVKYDQSDDAALAEKVSELRDVLARLGVAADRPVVLASSTHAGEEALIGEVCRDLRQQVDGLDRLFYLVVPRHAERGGQVLTDLERIGLKAARKSTLTADGGASGAGHAHDLDALIADTTGELLAWYQLADVVVVGKSLLGEGGQNPVEAIAVGKPVITGPYMQNFTAIMNDLERREGVLRLADAAPESLRRALTDLLGDPDESAALATRGLSALDQHSGAGARTARLILDTLADSPVEGDSDFPGSSTGD